MYNELLKIGPFTVYGYGLMIAIGIIAAYIMSEYRARKNALPYEHLISLAIYCVIGGIGGAKLLYYIVSVQDILRDPWFLLETLTDGFVVYGGIIGGIAGGWWYCRKNKLSFPVFFDLVMPSVALAQGFGRLGCFLAGCCYGKVTTGWFHITFRMSEFAPNHVPLIPTQLISSAYDFLIAIVLVLLAGKTKRDGQVAGLYLVLYSTGRFFLEFFRGDLERGTIGVLSTSQFISIFMFLIGCYFSVQGVKTHEKKERNS